MVRNLFQLVPPSQEVTGGCNRQSGATYLEASRHPISDSPEHQVSTPLTKCKSNFVNNPFGLDEESSVTTKIAQPTTPTRTPSLSLSTLGDAEELVKAVMDMQMTSTYAPKCICSHTPPEDLSDATLSPTMKCCCSNTSSESPNLQKPAKPITLQDIEHILLKLVDKRTEDSVEVSDNPKIDAPDGTWLKDVVGPASLLAFKEINEM
ncbi:hypothetical protein B7494_g8421 [Chlorociboria aeruginascens]|nr:hypothetical protein B7494_g8421 [Chlorociboria aeruginascens]